MAAFNHPLHEFLEDHSDLKEAVSYKAHRERMQRSQAEWNAFMKSWELDNIGQDELL